MDKKIFSIMLYCTCLSFSTFAQQPQPYVRKTVKPSFFIPENALAQSKPEKVFLPQYREGQTQTTKHISRIDAIAQESTPEENLIYEKNNNNTTPTEENISTNKEEQSPVETVEDFPSQQQDKTPEYQKLYQDYLKDLDNIANGQESQLKNTINQDLSTMNSEERIELDKNFNKQRNIQQEINQIIK